MLNMPSPSPVHPLIVSLKELGKVLALASSKKEVHPDPNTIDLVTKAIEDIIQKLKNPQLPSSSPDVITKIVDKIVATLETISKSDQNNATKYRQLIDQVNKYKPKKETPPPVGSDPPFTTQQDNQQPSNDESNTDHRAAGTQPRDVQSLTDEEKRCLNCFCLFSPGKEVKKREPIHMWLSLDLVVDFTKGAEILDSLVSKGFVERTVGNKKLCNRYKINESVRSTFTDTIDDKGSLCTLEIQAIPPQEPTSSTKRSVRRTLSRLPSIPIPHSSTRSNKDNHLLVLNRSENSLSTRTLDQLSKKSDQLSKKSSVKVLHLGCWDHDHKRYVMVDDMDALKSIIKTMGQVTFLSLQGISGIVELPDIVYRLEHLKVLDLRACPNLESIPEGIDSLKNLTHLDLSECYLLGHIPSKITSLTSLRVLKGFVINPEDQEDQGSEKETGKDKNSPPPSASFSELSNLKELIKLSIRTRRMNFPTTDDFDTLCQMKKLVNLRIAWVWSSVDSPIAGAAGRFPPSLKKLELQAAPEDTLSRLIRVVSEDAESTLEKLYIRGGRLWDLGMEMHNFHHVHTVRLRYLPELRVDWDEFKKFFPKLTRLEISSCPNLIFFPCDDNGVWEDTYIGISP